MISEKTKDGFFYLLGLTAIAFYSIHVYQNAYNIPKWDDFPDILRFLDHWLNANTSLEKYQVFISQTNEHILLVNHLLVLGQYYLIGHLNFSWLIYIGNMFYIGSALVLWLFFKDQKERACIFALLSLLCVTFYPYDSTLWAMTAISNQAVIFFALLAIYFASKLTPKIGWTMLFSCLAVFSQSNGLFILPVIAVYFYKVAKKKDFWAWLAFSSSVISFYFYSFNPASDHSYNIFSILQQLPEKNYFLILPAFVSYFGATFFGALTPLSLPISFILGAGILIYALTMLRKNQYPQGIILMLAFLLLSILSIVAYRGLIAGPQVIFVSRYKMYGACFLACAVVLSPVLIKKFEAALSWKIAALVFSFIFFFWSFWENIPQAKLINGDLRKSLQLWVEDGDFRRAKGFFIKDADSFLFKALHNKTYTPLALLPKEKIIRHIETRPDCSNRNNNPLNNIAQFSITHKNPNAAGIKILSGFKAATKVSVALCSESTFYTFTFTGLPAENKPDEFFIAREDIAPGMYDVFIKTEDQLYKVDSIFHNRKATR